MASSALSMNCLPGAPNWYQTDIIDVTSSGDLLAIGSKDTVMIMDVEHCKWVGGVVCHNRKKTTCVRWISYSTATGGGKLLSGGTDGAMRIVSLNSFSKEVKVIKSNKIGKPITSIDVTQQGHFAASFGGSVAIGEIESSTDSLEAQFKNVEKIRLTDSQITSLAFSRAATVLAVGCSNGAVIVLKGKETLFKWTSVHKSTIQSCNWSAMESINNSQFLLLATGSLDEKIALWKINTKTEPWTYQSHKLSLSGVCQSGTQASGAQSGSNRIWNAVTWCTLPTLESVLCTTCGSNFVLLVWDLQNLINKWCRGSPPGQPSKPQVVNRPRNVFSIRFSNGPVPYAVTSSLDPSIAKFVVSKSERGRMKELFSIPCIKSPPSQMSLTATNLVCGGNNELVVWRIPNSHTDGGEAAVGTRISFKYKRHWALINSSAICLHVDESAKKIYFALSSGDVGVASLDLQEKGSATTQKSESKIYKNIPSKVFLIRPLSDSLMCVVGSKEGTDCLFINTSKPTEPLLKTHLRSAQLTAVSFSGGQFVIAADEVIVGYKLQFDEQQQTWSPREVFEVNRKDSFPGTVDVAALKITPDGTHHIALSNHGGMITLLCGDRWYASKSYHALKITSLSWVGSNNTFLSSSLDGTIIFWTVSQTEITPTAAIIAPFPILHISLSHTCDVIYAATEMSLHCFRISEAMDLETSKCVEAHMQRFKTKTAGGGVSESSQIKRQKTTQRFITATEWLGGTDGGNRKLLTGDLETADKITVVKRLLGDSCTPRPSLGGSVFTGDNIKESILLSSGDIGAALRFLTGDAEGAVDVMLSQSPSEAGFWIGLTHKICGRDVWMRLLNKWCEQSSDVTLKVVHKLSFGMFSDAVEYLFDQNGGDITSLKLLVERFNVALPTSRRDEFLQSSIVKESRWYPFILIAFGGSEKSAHDILSVSTNPMDIRFAFSLFETIETADKLALFWLLGHPSTVDVLLPPSGRSDGSTHSVLVVRRSLVVSKEELRAEVPNPDTVISDLLRWLSTVTVEVPLTVRGLVETTIEILSEQNQSTQTLK